MTFKEFGEVVSPAKEKKSFKEFGEVVPKISKLESIVHSGIKGGIKSGLKTAEFLHQAAHPIESALGVPPPFSSDVLEAGAEKIFPSSGGAAERFAEKVGETAVGAIGPGSLASKAIRGSLSALGGFMAKESGLPESAVAGIETGLLLTPTKFKGAQKFVSDLYSKARETAGKDLISSKNLKNQTLKFLSELSKGGSASSKNAAVLKAKEILQKTKTGKIPVEELTEFKKTINEARANLYVQQDLNTSAKKMAKRNLDSLSKVVDDSLASYGKLNPKWNSLYTSANEGHGAIEQSKKVSNFVKKLVKKYPHASGSALSGILFGGLVSKPAAAAMGGSYIAVKSGELLSRIINSKTLRKYYQTALQNAVKENPGAFLKNMKKLEDEIEKSESFE